MIIHHQIAYCLLLSSPVVLVGLQILRWAVSPIMIHYYVLLFHATSFCTWRWNSLRILPVHFHRCTPTFRSIFIFVLHKKKNHHIIQRLTMQAVAIPRVGYSVGGLVITNTNLDQLVHLPTLIGTAILASSGTTRGQQSNQANSYFQYL